MSCWWSILHGEEDVQAPIQEVFLLEQRLSQVSHQDHTLYSYPGLGHSFYPVDGWKQPLGPIQEYVLSDIFTWLNDPARKVQNCQTQQQSYEKYINEMHNQLSGLNSELESAQSIVEDLHSDLQNYKKEIDELNELKGGTLGNVP